MKGRVSISAVAPFPRKTCWSAIFVTHFLPAFWILAQTDRHTTLPSSLLPLILFPASCTHLTKCDFWFAFHPNLDCTKDSVWKDCTIWQVVKTSLFRVSEL